MENANERGADTSFDASGPGGWSGTGNGWSTVPYGAPGGGASSLPPPPPAPVRWGIPDAFLTIPVALGAAIVATIVLVVAVGDDEENAIVAVSSVVQFGAMLWWAWSVSKRKGLGSLARDWGLVVKPIDLAIGLGVAVGLLIAGGIVATMVAELVGVDVDDASNTAIIEDAESSAWIWVIALVVTTLGPLAEELVFRGMFLRSLDRRFGGVVAIVGSALVFALPHITDGSFDGQLVLWSQIFVWGLVWSWAARHYGRLGPTLVAHVLVNVVGTVGTLVA